MAGSELPDLFARAQDLDASGRLALVAEVAAADPGLARELERLLAAAADDGEASPLDRSPWRDLGAGSRPAPEVRLPAAIGPYRVLSELGRGGMGRVYLAEQEGPGFSRRVALKVVVPGGAGPEVERRFREERRILAGLEHPGIARFYDAGRAEDGSWYLALEYVEGEDLLAFVRRRGLDLPGRVELFLQVLDAVDFAHRRLVVHRDLKPGNVVVGADGRPRLLDFGISKIVDPEAFDEAATRTELVAFTPAYASPEQLRGERPTVAADVFSLGVMLYELLAGRRPFARRAAPRLDPASAALERDPQPPSTAARPAPGEAEAAGSPATAIAGRDLAGDLDSIVLKALRAEPESRYPSAAAFAEDLRRWLAGEPVEARRGGRRYRVAKFVGRHRLALAAAAAVLVALAGGVSVALVERSRALAARARAEAALADLHQLTQSMLFDIYGEVRRLPGSAEASGRIVRRATEVLDRLAASAGDDPRLLADLASGHERLGLLLGGYTASSRSLRQPRAAVEALGRALAIRERLAARPGASFADRLAAAQSLGALALAQGRAGDHGASERSAEEGIRRLEALRGEAPDPGYLRYRLAVAHGRSRMRALREATGASPDDPHFAAAGALWREVASQPPPAALDDPEFPNEVWLGNVILRDAGQLEEALALSALGLEAIERRDRDLDAAVAAGRRANLLSGRVATLEALGRPAEALADLKEILRLRAASPPDPDDLLANSIRRLAETQLAAELAAQVGDLAFAEEAIEAAEGLLAEAERSFGAGAFASARVAVERARGAVLVGRAERAGTGAERRRLLAAAVATYREALALAQRLAGAGDVHGLPPEALAELREATARAEGMLGR